MCMWIRMFFAQSGRFSTRLLNLAGPRTSCGLLRWALQLARGSYVGRDEAGAAA